MDSIVVGVCYRLSDQDEELDEAFLKIGGSLMFTGACPHVELEPPLSSREAAQR